jgi:hypothetical protein
MKTQKVILSKVNLTFDFGSVWQIMRLKTDDGYIDQILFTGRLIGDSNKHILIKVVKGIIFILI